MFRIGQEELDALARVIKERKFFKTEGTECFSFEKEFCQKVDCKHSILMTSGEAALISALTGMGIGPGDEVIVPAYTYIATAMAVTAVGAIPVICEVDETLTIDVADMEKKIGPYTRAVIPVHMQGFPCDMGPLMKVAKAHGIQVLEDACQANGATWQGKRVGTFGDAGAFSFNFYKILSAGEGGCLITDNNDIYQKALIYHDASAVAFFGNQLDQVQQPLFCGTEYRANEFSAAILREQLKRLDPLVEDLRKGVEYVEDATKDVLTFIPCHDKDGRATNILAIRFDTQQQAEAFATCDGVLGTVPIHTGKHVYTNWQPILEHRGALHPAMNPFEMEQNRGRNMNYTKDMCPNTLQYLSTTVFVGLLPWGTGEYDWKQTDFDWKIERLRNAAKIVSR